MAFQKQDYSVTKLLIRRLYHPLRTLLFFTVFLTALNYSWSQELPSSNTPIPVKEEPKPEEEKELKVNAEDLIKPQDSTKKDSTTTEKKPFLEYKLVSKASRKRIDRRNNIITLYDNAIIEYGDTKLEAGKIVIDNNTGDVFAYGIVNDSTQAYEQKPVFTQGTNVVEPDSIIFNKDSKKALTYNSRTTQGEFNVFAETTKKVNDSVFYMKRARFTTSSNPDNPEYYFLAQKIKFVPKKKIVTGLVNMWIADVPTPIGLPFAYFPMTEERKSGVIVPSFGNNVNQGYFLQNGGYYFAINDYVDLTVLGDYFTNGSYGFRVESSYAKRYSFNGNFRFSYENQVQSERGFSDFRKSTIYNINWQHSQDPKANPDSRFSASVNLGSSRFYSNSFNQINQAATLNNNFSSSINYSKTFQGEPQVNFNIGVTHSQLVQTGEVTMNLPNFQGSVSRVFPFAPKFGAKKGIIENINLQYNVRAENRITTTDEDFLSDRMFEGAQSGIRHTIPVATNFKVGPFSVSANANYEETWVFQTTKTTAVINDQGLATTEIDTLSGFDSYRTYRYGASVGTTIYGLWENSNKKGKYQAIRHTIRPNISYSANPSFDQYYDRVLTESGQDIFPEERFASRFDRTLFGAPGRNFSSSIGIGVQNNLEAKVRERDTTKTEPRKVQLIKSLNFQTAYNLAGDSLQWSPINMSAVIPITKKIDLNLNANLDPYALDANNRRVDEFNINNGGSLFRLTNAGARLNFTLSDKDFTRSEDDEEDDLGDEKVENRSLSQGGREDDLFGKPLDYAENYKNKKQDPEEVNVDEKRYRFKIPWRLNIAYTMTYNNAARQNEINRQSLMVSGDVELSPRWSVGGNTGYDFANNGISFTTLRFNRDLESFRMSFNWTPIGPNQSWFFFIGIKASALSDIKWDQRRQPDPQF
ncbi:putative LPS assembly protein LptD [Nonlabens sp. SY33080]|uniref:putative LPS assembly protein LptD n=1 Tax=Nonlabens sp. SY33080 TaxID=2719911 RepID=UPI001428C9BF|nr:putative LPS assembly protein LptD [Nonlabens sp. SY33080]